MKRLRKIRGFTLVEACITLAISVTVMGFVTWFVVEAARGNYITNQRVVQSIELRRFSKDMIYTASRSNQFFLYRSVAATDHALPSDQLTFVPSGSDMLCPAGDFIAFVSYEFPKPTTTTYHRIQQIVCYYLDATPGSIGAIRKATIDLSKNIKTGAATLGTQVQGYDDGTSTTVVEKVITDFWGDTDHTKFETYAISARGLFTSETVAEGFGRLFYYRDARVSLMAAGQLYGKTNTDAKNTYTDSFCFSVTPRS